MFESLDVINKELKYKLSVVDTDKKKTRFQHGLGVNEITEIIIFDHNIVTKEHNKKW